MKIYLYLTDQIISFSLPKEISGSFSFDENPEEESKLINIEERNGQWVIYSTDESKVIFDNNIVLESELKENTFYIIRRNETNYLVYVSKPSEDNLISYSYDQTINLILGNETNCNAHYHCPLIKDPLFRIFYDQGQLMIEKLNNVIMYINNRSLKAPKYYLKNGDQINIYGLKIIVLPTLLLINNPGNNFKIEELLAKVKTYFLTSGEMPKNIEIKDVDLYKKDDYFSKSPRLRRVIEQKEIELSKPPHLQDQQELPFILTIGPMLTMGVMSMVMLINTLDRIYLKETTLEDSWPSLVMSGAMLLSMLLWPLLTKRYNKKRQAKEKARIQEKYTNYLKEKEKELNNETIIQKEILIENLIDLNQCLDIIKKKANNFWDKRIDQSDFLIARIGIGNELLDVDIKWPEEGFTMDEDHLKKQAEEVIEKYKYIENVPIGYSLYENKVTAIMGNKSKSLYFMNNILLQLLTYYSYDDLKLVVFTTEEDEKHWEYIKYLNHNFSDDKSIRFFASKPEDAKIVAEFLSIIVNARLSEQQNKTKKPYYLIIIDDYSTVKRFDFIKTITEVDENIGFSVTIIEERLSNLPSKCNNFISLGEQKSGILKNSYENQEQITFYDEINYKIDMMEIAKIISNIPIEFENGIAQLPNTITFLEMEKVGKVEQLNILNRWNTNDSTTSLKAEIGVEQNGELMYLDLHEKYHGPHGLIAGMTGSGKSEFIITYILSMAINYSPDDVSFILIDYKGGGLAFAFENKVTGISLPHLAGTITNLDKAEMDRTLVSIDSEIKRRQHLFNEARDKLEESTIDIYKYQRFYKEGKITEAIPHLFIVCDEFAELKSQQPDFMDNLISVARIGRSLGIHLILATQKPSGVVNDQIWSNSKFRVCLKVQDASDSNEMLKRPDAASLKQTGRFYLQVGYDEYFALGQSAWCGAKYYPSDKIVKQVDKSLNFINDCGITIKSIQASNNIKVESQGEQLASIMKAIIDIANLVNKKSRRLWLENIPEIILEEQLEKKYNIKGTPYQVEAIIGEYDAPEKQEQGIVKYNFTENGNTIIYGNDSSEREMVLNEIIYSASKLHSAEEVNFYIIDYGSESLRRYSKLPQIGGMVFAGEEEKITNLLKMVKEEIQKRKTAFVDYSGEYQNYIQNSNEKMPIFTVIMNNYDSIFESNQYFYDELPDLVRDSARYGIIFIFTANAINSVHQKIAGNCPNIYALKLKDAIDYASLFGVRSKTVPRDIVGRGIINNDGLHEFQTASIVAEEDNINEVIAEFVKEQKEKNPTTAKKIPVLPKFVRMEDIQQEKVSLENVPVGMSKGSLEICTINYLQNVGNIITSNKLANTEKFIKSILMVFKMIENLNIIVLDPMGLLNLNKEEYPNYYTNNLEEILDQIMNYISKVEGTEQAMKGIVIIYGLDKFLQKLTDSKKFADFVKKIKHYEKMSIIIVEEANKLKQVTFESWFSGNFSANDGIWIGRGIVDQNILRVSSIKKEMTKNIKNDMGYLINEGLATECKWIDFISKEEEDENAK